MNHPVKTELLAPAGSLESFFAAIEAGADAVYCGLKDFSARAKAKNFSLQDLKKMTDFCHSQNRRLYVPINTLIKEAELPRLIEVLGALEAMKIDGVILQDLAVWRLIRDHFPGLPLHGSTQLSIHNLAGVQQMERMGFERVVLARELTLEEIRHIRAHSTIELEHFIHGALCFCYSGQCYFSSWLGGKSGNRGRCAQPCRRQYSSRQKEGYYFSTNDLSAIDLMDELTGAGVISFKIEGRMKSAEYVHTVVGAYRSVIDAPPKKKLQTIAAAKQALKNDYGRLPTRGFLPSAQPTDVANPSLKGATGRFLGELTQVRGSEISFKTRDALHLGDRLRVQPKTDRAGSAFTVKTLRGGKKNSSQVAAGSFVTVSCPFSDRFKPGDTVFKVSDAQAYALSDNASRRRLEAVRDPGEGVSLKIEVGDNRLCIEGGTRSVSLRRQYEVELIPANHTPLSREILSEAFARTAEAPFYLQDLQAEALPCVLIPPSRLKALRRAFYEDLTAEVRAQGGEDRRSRQAQALASLPQPLARTGAGALSGQFDLRLGSLKDGHMIKEKSIERVILPVLSIHQQDGAQALRSLSSQKELVVWDIPFILLGEDWNQCRSAVQILAQQGYRHFRLNNLGHFPLFDGLKEMVLETGYRLFALNSLAVRSWLELGSHCVSLYVEDDRENMAAVATRCPKGSLSAMIYGSVPLISSRIPIKSLKQGAPVYSDRQDGYSVEQRRGITTLRSHVDFSLLPFRHELQAMGISRFTLDLSHLKAFSSRSKMVLEAAQRLEELDQSSSFNYLGVLE